MLTDPYAEAKKASRTRTEGIANASTEVTNE